MATAALTYYTPDEYLALERNAEFKSEYLDGRIVAMTGATVAHVTIAGNVFAELRARLRGGPCRAFVNDMRVQVGERRRYTYPDVSAVCGEPRFMDGTLDTLTNPALIVKVLSPSTEAYDRGEKFLHYRAIESLQEYVLVAQDRVLVERFVRVGEFWHLYTITDLDASLEPRLRRVRDPPPGSLRERGAACAGFLRHRIEFPARSWKSAIVNQRSCSDKFPSLSLQHDDARHHLIRRQPMSNKWITRLGLSLALLVGAPVTAFGQQMYECTWTVTIRTIVTTYENGDVVTRWEYDRTEYCRPIPM